MSQNLKPHTICVKWNNFLIPVTLLLFLTIGYLVIALTKGGQVRARVSQEPIYGSYTTDMMGYLKTYYLIKKGMPFYQAYALGEIGGAAGGYPGEIWGWKTPFLFYLWKIFPGKDGRSIYWFFTCLVLLIPLTSYLIAKELVGQKLAYLSSLLVWPYFLLPLKEITFIQVEWWALTLFLLGFYFLLKEKVIWTTLFFSFTLFARELFAVHLLSLLIVLLITKKRKMIISILLPFLFISLFYLFVHIPNVGKYEDLSILSDWWRISPKTINLFLSWKYVQTTLAFNSQQYLLVNLFPFRVSLILSSLALLYLNSKRKSAKYLLFLASFLPFFLFQFKPGLMTIYHDYWGIYYVPLTLIGLPAAVYAVLVYFKLKYQ